MSGTMIITFELAGKHRVANIYPRQGDFENLYFVVMDDGYENHFFTTPDRPYDWYEQHLGYTELAQVIGRAIEKHTA